MSRQSDSNRRSADYKFYADENGHARLGWVWRLNTRQNHLNGSFGWLAGPGSLALVGTEKVSKHFNRSAGLQTQTETIPPGSTPADQCPRGKSPPQAVQKSFSLEVPLYS